jgi:hypothetical protein
MKPSVLVALKVLASAILGLLSFPMLGYGGHLFFCWFRIHTSDVYYSEYSYVTAALIWFGIGLLSLWASLQGVWRRSVYGTLFALPVFFAL